MHDQKKQRPGVVDEETRRQTEENIQRFRALCRSCEESRKACRAPDGKPRRTEMADQQLAQLGILLAINPEQYSMFNYRRELLQSVWASKGAELQASAGPYREWRVAHTGTVLAMLQEELAQNTTILMKDFKVYAAFVHRKWIYGELQRCAREEVHDLLEARLSPGAGAAPPAETLCREGESSVQTVEGEGPARDGPPADAGALLAASRAYAVWTAALRGEKKQTERLLSIDERNFHAWNHRRWVLTQLAAVEAVRASALAALALPARRGECPSEGCDSRGDGEDVDAFVRHELLKLTALDEEEWLLSQAKINHNFSNYSAWHHRALIVQKCMTNGIRLIQRFGTPRCAEEVPEVCLEATQLAALIRFLRVTLLSEELGIAEKAMYCDPKDQASWFYGKYVVSSSAELCKHVCECVDRAERGGHGPGSPGADTVSQPRGLSAVELATLVDVREDERHRHRAMVSRLFCSCHEIVREEAAGGAGVPGPGPSARLSSLPSWPLWCQLFLVEHYWQELCGDAGARGVISQMLPQLQGDREGTVDGAAPDFEPSSAQLDSLLRKQLMHADTFRAQMYAGVPQLT